MSKLRIIHITEPADGGVMSFIISLIKRLPHYEHTIIYGNRGADNFDRSELQTLGCELVEWKKVGREISFMDDFSSLFELIGILKKIKNIDVIHLHSAKAGLLGRFAAQFIRASNKVVYTTHASPILRRDISKYTKSFVIFLEWLGSKLGGQIVACSKSEMEELKKFGINCITINNGVEDCAYIKTDVKNKIPVVGTVARVTKQKNPEEFFEIISSIHKDTKIKAIWVGDGELKNLIPNIELTGWVSREQVIEYIDLFDVYLSTSLWEGMPLSVLSAMLRSKPLLLHDCVGNRDLVRHGENGYLFNSASEAEFYLLKLLENGELRANMGKKSRSIVLLDYSLSTMISNYDNLYKKLQ